eukprot:299877-Rhodomonas_salina.3
MHVLRNVRYRERLCCYQVDASLFDNESMRVTIDRCVRPTPPAPPNQTQGNACPVQVVLRLCFLAFDFAVHAVSGHVTPLPPKLLRARYAESGTETGYAATRFIFRGGSQAGGSAPMVLRACYAMSGTVAAYGAMLCAVLRPRMTVPQACQRGPTADRLCEYAHEVSPYQPPTRSLLSP